MFEELLSVGIWQQLENWDKWLFLKINTQWTNPFFDAVLPYLRNSSFWPPLYLFILTLVWINFGRTGAWWSLLFICSVAIADMIGTRVFKENVERLRPCQDPDFFMYVRLLLKQCSGSFSFVSNHAANHFALATFMVLTFRGVFRSWIHLTYVWAFSVAYAQVYVGVHYPLDVIAGAGLGIAAGTLSASVFKNRWGTLTLDTN
jgi:membrane-associated phospholipid phosphatase